MPYSQAEGGKIDIKFECDEDDKQYQDVTYKLKSGKEGSCTKSDENFDKCPEVRTILNVSDCALVRGGGVRFANDAIVCA